MIGHITDLHATFVAVGSAGAGGCSTVARAPAVRRLDGLNLFPALADPRRPGPRREMLYNLTHGPTTMTSWCVRAFKQLLLFPITLASPADGA